MPKHFFIVKIYFQTFFILFIYLFIFLIPTVHDQMIKLGDQENYNI